MEVDAVTYVPKSSYTWEFQYDKLNDAVKQGTAMQPQSAMSKVGVLPDVLAGDLSGLNLSPQKLNDLITSI